MSTDPVVDQLLFGVEEAAERLGVGRTKLRELLSSGEVRSVRIGARRLVPSTALAEYVDRLQATT